MLEIPDASSSLSVRVLRGGRVESEHRIEALCWREGRSIRFTADPQRPVFLRSAAKPFQTLATLEALMEEGEPPEDPEICVIAASHSGQPRHVAIVRRLLERNGLEPAALRCGPHAPMHAPERRRLVRDGVAPDVLHNNCSGKHAGMLLAARARGAALEDYLDPDHPVQRRNREVLALFCDLDPDRIGVAVDGCSAPTFIVPLEAAARAYARLGQVGSVAFSEAPWRRLLDAIPRHPLAYAGDGRTCTRLTELGAGHLYPKLGAEAFYAVAAPGRDFGLALKVLDGGLRAVEPAVAGLLERLADFLPEAVRATLRDMSRPPLKNHAGLLVGQLEVRIP